MIGQFKPALLFLIKFLGVYVVGNIFYGLYIAHYLPQSDPVTGWVSYQVAEVYSIFDQTISVVPNLIRPTISLVDTVTNDTIINVFEGCNGINVVIVFLAFIVAYQGTLKRTIIFSCIGFLIIHLFNLARIMLLFEQAKNHSPYFYYVHKYFFTAILYFVVVLLWWFWISKFNSLKDDHRGQV